MSPADRQDARRARATTARPLPHSRDPHAQLFTSIHRDLEQLDVATDYIRHRFRIMADPVLGPHRRRLMRHEITLAGVPVDGAAVLDAGCGPGAYSIELAASGAHRVLAVDHFPENVAALAAIAGKFGLPIHAVEGDAAAIEEPDDSFDLIYCREAISHFADWPGFVRECVRLLRPGGAVVVSDGNNGANPLVRGRIHAAWRRSEHGPFESRTFPNGEPLPYLFRRWMMIQQELPGLPQEQLFRLGLSTTTLGGPALREALRRFAESGEAPGLEYRVGMSVRRPEDGQRDEEPIDPLDLARRWRALGLVARVHPHFGFGRGALLRVLNLLAAGAPAVTACLAPAYVVTARRPSLASGPPRR